MDLPDTTFSIPESELKPGVMASLQQIHTLSGYLLALHAQKGESEAAFWRAVRLSELRNAEESLAYICGKINDCG